MLLYSKGSGTEVEKVKFLQEAAIMGQFHHHLIAWSGHFGRTCKLHLTVFINSKLVPHFDSQ